MLQHFQCVFDHFVGTRIQNLKEYKNKKVNDGKSYLILNSIQDLNINKYV